MTDMKIFTENIEEEALEQINRIAAQSAFQNCKIRIMPDVHPGKACVIGFTSTLSDKIIPNIIGVDIGCGMAVIGLGNADIDYAELDNVIRTFVPSGHEVHNDASDNKEIISDLLCKPNLRNTERLNCSMGTLGGGNHFIEIDMDEDNNKYLIIHTGSRNLGLQVANYYQKLAINNIRKANNELEISTLISKLKAEHREKEIQTEITYLKERLTNSENNIPDALCYLTGNDYSNYLHDMRICQTFAYNNRKMIAEAIIHYMGWSDRIIQTECFETIHNYIDDLGIIRKGAVAAHNGQKLLIPMNMRDGCILGIGKGNTDWNESAPHGAGRVMSRTKAKETLSMEEYIESMNGIWTTSVNQYTIDESAMVYKPSTEIINLIQDTVQIQKILKPVYNFKASE